MTRPFLPLLVLTAASFVACKSVATDVSAEIGSLGIGGAIGIDKTSVKAKNSVGALGLTRDDGVPDLRLDLQWDTWKTPHLTVSGFQSSHDGRGRLDQDMSQGAVTITAGTQVDSNFDLGLYSAVLTFDFSERPELEAGLGFGLGWVDLEANFTSLANGDEIFTDESRPVPLLAGRLGWRGDRFAAAALLSGITGSYGGDRASFIDADLRTEMRIFGRKHATAGALVAGWRYLHSSVEYGDARTAVDASVSLNGPYLGFALHF